MNDGIGDRNESERRHNDFITKFCASFPDPEAKWRRGSCNLATHVKNEKKETAQKINPLKASKRKAAGR